MDIGILGHLEAFDDEGRALALGGRQQRVVLAMLVLRRNEVVPVDQLVDAVWGEQAPVNAIKNVQIHVSRLRKALGGASGKDNVHTRAGGYVLDLAPGELDADRFQGLVEEGRRALAAAQPEQAAAVLQRALELWRGSPLADFAYDSFAQAEIGRLEELRLGTVEERIETDLALGRHDDVVAELQGLVTEHPLRERLRGQLMLALYRSGRKADALRVYDEARRAAGGGARSRAGRRPSAPTAGGPRGRPGAGRAATRAAAVGDNASSFLCRPPRRSACRRRRARARGVARGRLACRHVGSNVRRHRRCRAELVGPNRSGDESGRRRDSRRGTARERRVRRRVALGGEPRRRERAEDRPEGAAPDRGHRHRHSRERPCARTRGRLGSP